MRWIKIAVYILIIYGITSRQPIYTSSARQKAPDRRADILTSYFLSKGSPLASSSLQFVKTADKYNLDWRLLPAIAGVESTFETNGNTSDHNPFGYMCSGRPCYFGSYSEAIETDAKTISTGGAYKNFQQSKRIYDLAKTYTALPQDWTGKVEIFMNQIGK